MVSVANFTLIKLTKHLLHVEAFLRSINGACAHLRGITGCMMIQWMLYKQQAISLRYKNRKASSKSQVGKCA